MGIGNLVFGKMDSAKWETAKLDSAIWDVTIVARARHDTGSPRQPFAES